MGGKPKFRGYNLLKEKIPNTKPVDRSWQLFVGDKVEIVGGRGDIGKQGKILELRKKIDMVVVEGCRLGYKHVKPSADYPKGAKLQQEMPIKYDDVKLVDPVLNKPTDVELVPFWNEQTRRTQLERYSVVSQTHIPKPEQPEDKEGPEGPVDTTPDLVAEVTFVPSIAECPFPAAFLNQLEKMRRHNKEGHAF
ncbi:39S ribosomal protein L24, mitochondrial [Borealophlyctis nickersoniae]|nr:39S ribosomal protein L24, mitochondrial [Borealophlyctis nickersoniae]